MTSTPYVLNEGHAYASRVQISQSLFTVTPVWVLKEKHYKQPAVVAYRQRRSQVSLAGGADRIPGGGGDKPQYL